MLMFDTLEPRQLMSHAPVMTWRQFITTQLQPSRAVVQVDTNRDGRNDLAVFDRNRDGFFDTILSDQNRDGRYDFANVDTNLDGKFDAILACSRGNNVIDRLVIDTNRDGAADTAYADVDGNLTFRQRLNTNRVDNNLGLPPARPLNQKPVVKARGTGARNGDVFSAVTIRDSQRSTGSVTFGPRGP